MPAIGEVISNLVPIVVFFCLIFWFGVTKLSEGAVSSAPSEFEKEDILVLVV